EVPVSLYRLSLEPSTDHAIATAQKIADVPQIPRPTSGHRMKNPRYGRYGSQVTAMDIARDGSAAMILTYSHAYRFPRNSGESWEDVFRKSPEPIPLPPMRQAESVCFAPDGTSIYVTSEQRPNPLHRLFLELPGGD
ncbi:MAG: hypothetical protein KBA51_02140, partial [Kiritimatiellae bacterium]|nr:hypothetical protein [Kiritimatiellia bacterium]